MPDFYIDDHAVLFALLAKRADERCGEEGLAAVERALVSYGRERGLRSALRCRRDGGKLTLRNYLLYGEWIDERRWSKSQVAAIRPDYQTDTLVCGWNESWKKYDLTEHGKIYCRWIDAELLRGFNPDLRLEMGSILSDGGATCHFHWPDFRFEDEADVEQLAKERAELAPRVTQGFLYHCAHLYSTFRREFYRELGPTKGNAILEKASSDYEGIFGPGKMQAILAEAERNFISID